MADLAGRTYAMGVAIWEREADDDTARSSCRAARYVRMSTEHQQYSAQNQIDAIDLYGAQRGFDIIRTYIDAGRSGLSLAGRPALQQLLADIETGVADYVALLVYDVSRLGRFQDPDEAASYELRCRRAGVAVHYCAEQFENDGTMGSSIIKTVKRAMAGEFSRELSVKVFAGQANLVRLGFRQGGVPGYGLRRFLVDQQGRVKAELSRGEEKNLATDRIILGHGPAAEVETVREIFRLFIDDRLNEQKIADLLNARRIPGDRGGAWTRGRVYRLLINEKYVGDNVWARTSCKLKQPSIHNAPEAWIRAEGAFEPIVDRATHARARAIIAERAQGISDEEMLNVLRAILADKGTLTGAIIDGHDNAPCKTAYQRRFGSLLGAYRLIGYMPAKNFGYLDDNQTLRDIRRAVLADLLEGVRAAGGSAVRDAGTGLVTINGEVTVAIALARCLRTHARRPRWKLRPETLLRPDLTIVIRMEEGNRRLRDFFVLPLFDLPAAARRLADHNGLALDAYRHDTLAPLLDLARRQSWSRSA